MTNPALPELKALQLVSPTKLETPSVELALSFARMEVRLAPNGLTGLRALQHEADLILGLTAAFAGKSLR